MYTISLKAARVNAGLTQGEVAEKLNVDRTTIINWEKGKVSLKHEQLLSLCQLYNVPVVNIFLPKQ